MTTKSRRRVLKGLGVALPATWARPVVESVLLPAHAQSSPESSPGCGIEPGCYPLIANYISWPGGAGPEAGIARYSDVGCQNFMEFLNGDMVVAASLTQAMTMLDCGASDLEVAGDVPSMPNCQFYWCD